MDGHLSLAFDADGNPALSSIAESRDQLNLTRWNGAGCDVETLDTDWEVGTSLAFDGSGDPAISHVSSHGYFRVVRSVDDVTLFRGRVGSLVPGWRAIALPLTSENDDETPPFPLVTTAPGSQSDPSAPTDPLVLYRILAPTGAPAGGSLRVVKRPAAIEIGF